MSIQNRFHRTGLPARVLAITAVLVFSSALLAAAPRKAMKGSRPYMTAIAHARFAVNSTTVKMIQMHLHHVMNCLEGKHGEDFDLAAGNPCDGHGALETLKKGSPDWIRAENAIKLARIGEHLRDEKPDHYVAEAVLAILTEGMH